MLKIAINSDRNIYLCCGFLAVIILLIDLNIPLGVASGVPYIIVILLSLKSEFPSTTLILASFCTLFVFLGFIYSPDGGIFWQVLANRGLAVFSIWATALLAINQLKRERLLSAERIHALKISQEAMFQEEKIKVLRATMRTVLDIMNNFLNGLQLVKIKIDQNKTLTNEELKQLDTMIQDAASNLKKLANIEEIKEKKMAGGFSGIDLDNVNGAQF
ncbi:MAG: hypothetical protein H6936_13555 [Burkholderiales bacterium]|nr:hypothetical protein [Nitrosomonas sp.]MCP5275848.1 hypothetical protein [Burkholderiales bacterium]